MRKGTEEGGTLGLQDYGLRDHGTTGRRTEDTEDRDPVPRENPGTRPWPARNRPGSAPTAGAVQHLASVGENHRRHRGRLRLPAWIAQSHDFVFLQVVAKSRKDKDYWFSG